MILFPLQHCSLVEYSLPETKEVAKQKHYKFESGTPSDLCLFLTLDWNKTTHHSIQWYNKVGVRQSLSKKKSGEPKITLLKGLWRVITMKTANGSASFPGELQITPPVWFLVSFRGKLSTALLKKQTLVHSLHL